jgi:hypothetical protein
MENQLRHDNTFNSNVMSFHIWLLKKIDTYIAKQCSHVEEVIYLLV